MADYQVLDVDGGPVDVEVQPAAEKLFVDLAGKKFEVAEKASMMAVLKFAHIAYTEQRRSIDELESMEVTYQFLETSIAAHAWDDFVDHATKERCDLDELIECASQALGLMSERPTQRPSGSPDGSLATAPSSPENSSSPESSTPSQTTDSAAAAAPSAPPRQLVSVARSPLMDDPRVAALRPLEDVAMDLLNERQLASA